MVGKLDLWYDESLSFEDLSEKGRYLVGLRYHDTVAGPALTKSDIPSVISRRGWQPSDVVFARFARFNFSSIYSDDLTPLEEAQATAEALVHAGKKPVDESELVTACYQKLNKGSEN